MIVEIVGAGGCREKHHHEGLGRALPAVQGDFRLRTGRFVPAFVGRAILSLPRRLLRGGTKLPWEVLKMMVYLENLHRILSEHASRDGGVILLDQGPVYALTYLREFGFEGIQDPGLNLWWKWMLDCWSSTLDVIVWVDAQDRVLLQRILQRKKAHRVKGQSAPEVFAFLAHYRAAYEEVIHELAPQGAPGVWRFATDEQPVEQIVQEIMDVLGLGPGECRSAIPRNERSRLELGAR